MCLVLIRCNDLNWGFTFSNQLQAVVMVNTDVEVGLGKLWSRAVVIDLGHELNRMELML